MLVRRITSAALLVLPIIAILVFAPARWAAVTAFALYFIAAWEWSGFLKNSDRLRRIALLVIYAAAMSGAAWMLKNAVFTHGLFMLTLVWWLIAGVWITRFPTRISDAVIFICGLFVLVPPLLVILQTRSANETAVLIFVFAVVWAADIGAYFTGRALGKHKLAPNVSPGKTWEGFAGGMVAAVLAALAMGLVSDGQGSVLKLMIMGLLIAIGSVIGDLTVSMFKRHSGVKDSGAIFPGHGGVMDRFDSFSAAAPVMFSLWYSLGHVLGWAMKQINS